MALFNDGPINGIEELARYDSSLLETSTIEGIDVVVKAAGARDAIGTEILTFLLDNQPAGPVFGDLRGCGRRAAGLADVVVTAELKRWHAFQVLREVYQDAYGHQSNDRYEWKWQEYGTLARTARAGCMDVGIGLAADPIAKPLAPLVAAVAGGGPGAILYFAVTLVNAEGEEGVASDVVMLNVAATMQARVTPGTMPENARGWNVYAGSSPATLMKQNGVVLGVSETWTQASVLSAGSAPGDGQRATLRVVQNRVIRRG